MLLDSQHGVSVVILLMLAILISGAQPMIKSIIQLGDTNRKNGLS